MEFKMKLVTETQALLRHAEVILVWYWMSWAAHQATSSAPKSIRATNCFLTWTGCFKSCKSSTPRPWGTCCPQKVSPSGLPCPLWPASRLTSLTGFALGFWLCISLVFWLPTQRSCCHYIPTMFFLFYLSVKSPNVVWILCSAKCVGAILGDFMIAPIKKETFPLFSEASQSESNSRADRLPWAWGFLSLLFSFLF